MFTFTVQRRGFVLRRLSDLPKVALPVRMELAKIRTQCLSSSHIPLPGLPSGVVLCGVSPGRCRCGRGEIRGTGCAG